MVTNVSPTVPVVLPSYTASHQSGLCTFWRATTVGRRTCTLNLAGVCMSMCGGGMGSNHHFYRSHFTTSTLPSTPSLHNLLWDPALSMIPKSLYLPQTVSLTMGTLTPRVPSPPPRLSPLPWGPWPPSPSTSPCMILRLLPQELDRRMITLPSVKMDCVEEVITLVYIEPAASCDRHVTVMWLQSQSLDL